APSARAWSPSWIVAAEASDSHAGSVPSKTGDTGLVLLVPEADAAVGLWRTVHDPSAREGMPAHITVLYPFIPTADLDAETLAAIAVLCREWQPVTVAFTEFGRFPAVLW